MILLSIIHGIMYCLMICLLLLCRKRALIAEDRAESYGSETEKLRAIVSSYRAALEKEKFVSRKKLGEAHRESRMIRDYAKSQVVRALEIRVAMAAMLDGARDVTHWLAKSVDNSDLDSDLVFTATELRDAGASQKAIDLLGI